MPETKPDTGDEFEKIELIKLQLGSPSTRVELGIGDDAAVVHAPQSKMLLCSDALVEDVHFDLTCITPEELGHKALASCLSDIAAMNGTPLYALVSVALPKRLSDSSFLNSFYRGLSKLAREYKVDVVGGDLTFSPHAAFIDISLVGETPKPYTRSGARVGDVVAVSGSPGSSAAGLRALKRGPVDRVPEVLKKAHLCPRPRFDLLPGLTKISGLCTAMIDISDGISNELHHIAKASQVGFEVWAKNFPLLKETILEAGSRETAIELALSGGEDYELLATFKQDLWIPTEGWTVIGRVTGKETGLKFITLDNKTQPLVATGYNHFKLE